MEPHQSSRTFAPHEMLNMEGHGALLIVTKEGMAVRADSGTIRNAYAKEFTDPPAILSSPAYGSSEVGAIYSLVAASTDSIELPATLFDNASEGEIAILANFTSQAGTRAIINTTNGASISSLILDKSNTGNITFTTDDGTTTDTLQGSGGPITHGQWHLIGASWGPAGKSLYVDGVRVAQDLTKVSGVGAGTDQPAIGRRASTTYTTMDVAAFVVFNKQYGDWLHDAWQREPLLSAAA